MKVTIPTKAAYDLLVSTRGDLERYANNREAFAQAYDDEMVKTLEQMRFQPRHMLDIGCGLGIIDVLLIKSYGTHCTLLDGDHTTQMKKHSEPFVGRETIAEVMHVNDVHPDLWQFITPTTLNGPVFDQVLSMRSWCFHYPPESYLGFVQQHTCAGAFIMVDMRKGKPEWRKRMRAAFSEQDVVETGDKFERVIYRVRGWMQ